MKRIDGLVYSLLFALTIGVSNSAAASPNSEVATINNTLREESFAMTQHAKGTFDVKLVPLASDAHGPASPIGRMSNDKQFHGDIEGISKGQMLMIGTSVEGSAAYVSIEVVTGSVHGCSGSFALQHNGIMTRGVGQLAVTVVPDSGTDALQGIVGTLTISVAAGVHGYDFVYSLPDATERAADSE